MKRQAFSVHAHFYQPPREDPFTGEIPPEPGAAPFKNWNERIFNQCYKPNAELGNFERISFNIGPTLVSWMAEYHPDTLALIIEQERRNVERYRVGNGMAQAYNHSILPLANRQDKITQVRWGIEDFRYRFGHAPIGMWLPETAVDLETLEILAENGIEFTILAPWQAACEKLDNTQPYWVNLPNDRRIAVFFYSNLSGQISFSPAVTVNADEFVQKYLLPQYPAKTTPPGLAQILIAASDGELYGHHQPFREKFLEYLTTNALENQSVEPTYVSLWFRQHPPRRSINILERTSWSCHHGVTRWAGICDCAPHADWKEPFRKALNWLADGIDAEYQRIVGAICSDPWELRNQYIHAINGEISSMELIKSMSQRQVGDEEIRKTCLLLSAQYERQRMFTSCGWFFDDFNRIEPRNNVAYAARAVCLTYLATGVNLAPKAQSMLREVRSYGSGVWASTVFKHQLRRAKREAHEDTCDNCICITRRK